METKTLVNLFRSSLSLAIPSTFITALLTFILSERKFLATVAVGAGSGMATCTTVAIIRYSQNRKLGKLLSYDVEQFEEKKKELEQKFEEKKKELEQKNEQLLHIKGQFAEMKGRYDKLEEEVNNLANKKIDIEERISYIQIKNPQLEYQEELQRSIEQARLESKTGRSNNWFN